jgi:hypothetical protein
MPLLLLLLRILSAALLLAFLLLIVWLIYRDMQTTAQLLAQQGRPYGFLRVIACEDDLPLVDTRFPLLPVTTIGRASSSTIVLDNSYVSTEHALITRRGDQWWLEDMGSRNGTLLNGVALTETAVISVGDVIAVGPTYFKVEL